MLMFFVYAAFDLSILYFVSFFIVKIIKLTFPFCNTDFREGKTLMVFWQKEIKKMIKFVILGLI